MHSDERALHSVIHYFISCHLPGGAGTTGDPNAKIVISPGKPGSASSSETVKKSNLKQKEYQILLQGVDKLQTDFFAKELSGTALRKRR